jgi:hypothetical protein
VPGTVNSTKRLRSGDDSKTEFGDLCHAADVEKSQKLPDYSDMVNNDGASHIQINCPSEAHASRNMPGGALFLNGMLSLMHFGAGSNHRITVSDASIIEELNDKDCFFSRVLRQLNTLGRQTNQDCVAQQIHILHRFLNNFDDVQARGQHVSALQKNDFKAKWTAICRQQRFNEENFRQMQQVKVCLQHYLEGCELREEPKMRNWSEYWSGAY